MDWSLLGLGQAGLGTGSPYLVAGLRSMVGAEAAGTWLSPAPGRPGRRSCMGLWPTGSREASEL